MAVDFLGIQSLQHLNRIFHLNNQDFSSSSSSSSFNQAVSALNRSGHARFRRGPPPPTSHPHAPSVSYRSEEKKETIPPPKESISSFNDGLLKKSTDLTTSSFQSMTSSLASSVAEGSVSNGRSCLPSLGIVAPAPSFSSRKPPLPSSHRKRHIADMPLTGRANHSVSRNGCHCCKRRKTGSKREIKRAPVNGSKVESIPADDYSWKKYGEKKVDGSPFPRVYYKCSSAEGCPARKRVELALTDSKMLVVTYDREHRH